MKRILFLCSQNKLRSPTAEAIFADYPWIEVDSAVLNIPDDYDYMDLDLIALLKARCAVYLP
ncbi:MAG: hypothetical protein NWR21_11495 [Verrucomicrobiales bacterium]|jgi:predicted protein tyrosine phosphatase|nr:hypothetical protein [Verrucomicrobiales bacterium]MDP4792494.1 hypothetical protein [Verrucomicrobiales bacterium]MDP4939929.1 hypothetical protein [Verrucomicrobiales bacterium]